MSKVDVNWVPAQLCCTETVHMMSSKSVLGGQGSEPLPSGILWKPWRLCTLMDVYVWQPTSWYVFQKTLWKLNNVCVLGGVPDVRWKLDQLCGGHSWTEAPRSNISCRTKSTAFHYISSVVKKIHGYVDCAKHKWNSRWCWIRTKAASGQTFWLRITLYNVALGTTICWEKRATIYRALVFVLFQECISIWGTGGFLKMIKNQMIIYWGSLQGDISPLYLQTRYEDEWKNAGVEVHYFCVC